jgi:molybdopterin synthase catalytic subunit
MVKKTISKIVENEINLNLILEEISDPSTGAVVMFTGIVRGLTEGRNPHETIYLEYEAYQPMAEKKMQEIADEMRKKWPKIEAITIIQRTGRQYPATPSVMVACSAAHREDGIFEAARYGIDRLKEIVPVWKKEVTPSGEKWVEGDHFPESG